MAGVVAMASIIEDFDTQPCKKSRKDGGSPIVKTITNYFSPVAKPAEKPFSPPRSNNIMDYFSRRAPSSKEKTSSPEQSKENCQMSQPAGKHSDSAVAVKQPSQRRGRKAIKAARKLVEAENVSSTEEVSCLISEGPHESKDSAVEVTSSCGVLGSDTAALLAQFSAEACLNAGITDATTADVDQADTDEQHEDASKGENSVALKPELMCISLSPVVPLGEKAKQGKTTARNSRKRHKQEAKQPEPEEKELETSLCDVSMENNVDETSQLNNSTVTISFEEFVRSQSEDMGEEDTEHEQGKEEGINVTAEAQEMDTDRLKNVGSWETSLQVSPRTVTIQAEVHVVSPKQEGVKAVGKLASIFNKRKGPVSPAEVSSPHTEAVHQPPSTLLPVKRKSNVVLQEEDLELAVLESDSTPKCSEAERKQFMAAFKQPGTDGSKTKPGKSQGKQKQPGEKNLDPAEKDAEEDSIVPPSVEQVPASSQEGNLAKKKPARKGRKKAKEENKTVTTAPASAPDPDPDPDPAPAPAPTPAEETDSALVNVDDKKEEPSVPALRRSRREAVVRHIVETTPITPVRKNRKQNKSKEATADDDSTNCSVKMSTPKTRKSKHGIFVAEMVCPPDTQESPIRIKFTRVHKNISVSKAESGSDINTSMATKTSKESKKMKQAKKLVEKAKVMQQSKKTAVNEKGTVRRSSRNETSKTTKKSYCEDEDSIICLEEAQAAPGKSQTRKPLRSLNDVLGKAAPAGKEAKAAPGSKVALLGQEKSARKASAVVSIFDESSREGSENSQDDEQFRARREFLKSGLPESFRKQIAKTAATKEAYSLSCSSFQTVIHMKQPPTDCPLWSLPWPDSPLLHHLNELWSQAPISSVPPVSGSFCVKTEPARRAICERGSGWRPEISESVRQLLMEEVSASNPPFPVQNVISRFLKRRIDHQQQHFTASEQEPTRVTNTSLLAEPVGGKRKRAEDEGENTVKVAKKQRGSHSEETVPTPEPELTKRGGRARRGQRPKQDEEESKEKTKTSNKTTPAPCDDDSVVVVDDLLLGEDTAKKDVVKEDVLWTDKYQPQHSSDIIGNAASVRRLHSWLKEWKLRADQEERKKQKEKKREECGNDSDWDCGEEESQDGEDTLCNTMLITGPTGVGKTAAVYACAQELGFKVFEVNASSQRSGRLILSQLREATQSHQVDSQGVNAHKPTYFNSYGTSSSTGTVRPGSSPRKVNSPRRVVSSPRKHPQSPRGARKGSLAPTSLANFFKMGRSASKELPNAKKNEQTATSKKPVKTNEATKNLPVKSPSAATPKEKNGEEQSKKTATSLILFEEVDVIFDDDSGFLAAIKTFMTTTKRPVILTTSDPAFSTMFDGNFEEIHFKTPSVSNIGSYLQLLCLAEDMRTDLSDISSLLRLNGCDIRQSLLQLQLWTRSAGRRRLSRKLTHTDTTAELKPEADGEASSLPPPCDSGCTESKLGLLNVEPERDIWELLRNQSPAEEAVCWQLLTDSKRRGVDLLYNNMEALLPLPLTQLTTSTPTPQPRESQERQPVAPKEQQQPPPACPQPDAPPPHAILLHAAESADFSEDGSPVKVSSRMRKNKRRHCLPDQDGLHSDSDSEESFLSLRKPPAAPRPKEEVEERLVAEAAKRKPPSPEERAKSVPVSQCLASIADFFDNMSYADSCSLVHPEAADARGRTSSVGAAVKDGMTDESRAESDGERWARAERGLEIQAAVEALSFRKCRGAVAEAWDKALQLQGQLGKEAAEELSLPVGPHRNKGYSFTQDGPCHPLPAQRRREVMESLLGTLGNRPTAALDYLPALRTICRSEQLKEQGKVKRRFLHYLDAIHLGLGKSTLQHLAEDFP